MQVSRLRYLLGEDTLNYDIKLNEYLKALYNKLSVEEYVHGRYKILLDNKKVGILEIDEFEPEFLKPHFKISSDYQRKGITTALIRALTRLAKAYNKKVKIVVSNTATSAFARILSKKFIVKDLASGVYIVECTGVELLRSSTNLSRIESFHKETRISKVLRKQNGRSR